MAEIFAKLSQIINDLAPSEQKVGKYLLEHSDSVMGISIEQLAAKSTASQAAVTRFCKKMGYKGYRDLSIQLAAQLAAEQKTGDQEEYKDINIGDDVDTIMRNISYHNAKAIEDSLALTDTSLVQESADLLYRAQHIDF